MMRRRRTEQRGIYRAFRYGGLAVLFAIAACSTDPPVNGGDDCTEGDRRVCQCPGGGEGIQECGADGAYGGCDCPDEDAGIQTGDDADNDNGEEDPSCVNLCRDQMDCPEGESTTLTGTVYAPNGTLPIPNAAVYVPNVPLEELPPVQTGAVCEQCDEQALGSPLVGTISDFDGAFEFEDVPVADAVPLVIRLGPWRRVVEVDLDPQQHGCQTTELDAGQTRFPTRQAEGSEHDNLPKTAIATGVVDAMECVLHQIGIEASEYSRHSEDGRIHLYRANGGVADQELSDVCENGSVCSSEFCTDRDRSCRGGADGAMLVDNLSHHLYEDQETLNSYDMVVMDCEGRDLSETTARADENLDRIRNYVNSGGRLFASHWAYDWLHQNDELGETVDWSGTSFGNETLAYVDDTFPGGEVFWNWLKLVGADHPDTGPGGQPQIEIVQPRGLARSVEGDLATRWLYTDGSQHQIGADSEQYLTYNTPVYDPEDEQCGQVSYSGFHVVETHTSHGPPFPDYCSQESMTPQEKVLAYMLFDLAACVTEQDTPPNPADCFRLGQPCQLDSQCCSNTCAIESGEDEGNCITG